MKYKTFVIIKYTDIYFTDKCRCIIEDKFHAYFQKFTILVPSREAIWNIKKKKGKLIISSNQRVTASAYVVCACANGSLVTTGLY